MRLRIQKQYTSHKTRIFWLFLVFAIILGSILSETTSNADTSQQRVYDNANLLSTEEIASLEELSLEIGSKYETTIYILSDVDSQGKSRQTYMEDFADSKEVVNSTLLFVNMDPENRGFEIQGYGDNEYFINSSRIESILDAVFPYLKDGEYYQAFITYLEETDYYLSMDPSEDTSIHVPDNDYASSDKYYAEELDAENKTIFEELWFQILLSLAMGGIVVGIMAFNSGGRVTTNERTYLDSNHSRVLAHRDDYIRTTTTRIKKPSNNNHGGGGGGGISSGGRSHSGGGRSF